MIIKSALDRAHRNQLLKEEAKTKKFIMVGRNGAEGLVEQSAVNDDASA
jgi:hypothetical protein